MLKIIFWLHYRNLFPPKIHLFLVNWTEPWHVTCQQFHGGMGFIRETAIERLWRDARVLAIGGGATEVMLEEVAKRY